MRNVPSSKVNSKITFHDKHVAVHSICTVPYATSSLCLALLDTHRVKVKCTLVQAVGLGTGRRAHSGSRGIALLPLCAGWARGPFWRVAEILAPPSGIRQPDRPARSQSLYRLRYPAHLIHIKCLGNSGTSANPSLHKVKFNKLHFC